MSADERHRAILARVAADGTVSVRELAESLGVAAVTLRVDVRELARRGLVNRVHGAVTRVPSATPTASPAAQAASSAASSAGAPHGLPAGATIPLVNGAVTGGLPTGLSGLAAGALSAPGEPSGKAGASGGVGGAAGRTIGMVVPHAAYYYPTVVRGAREVADALGVRLVLGVSQNDVTEERALVRRLLESGVDGLLIATCLAPQRSPETQAWLRTIPVPVVLVERRAGWESGEVEHVATDHERGAYDAIAHLARLGHRRVGLVQLATITAPRLRTGYEAAVAGLGLTQPDGFPLEITDESPAELERVAEAVAAQVRAQTLDALLVHHDAVALPLVSHLRRLGAEIPRDLAVVAYDDELAALGDPPLTAIAPPRAQVGASAVWMLAERLKDPSAPGRHALLRPTLHVRQSGGSAEVTSSSGVDSASSSVAEPAEVAVAAGEQADA